ncbi:MAG: arabinogalactan endo,4-beta-galactosidase [Streptosporangiaceae bacterium]|jgi:arabinogalactan endo-1,4-beta-galactosidase|nr:arabinogalactan endo,4-beta-galactosidase [Streptosporangiaceae bacterium]
MVSPGIDRLLALLAGRLTRWQRRDGHRRPSKRSLALVAGPMVLLLPLLPLAASGSSASSSQASPASASAAADSAAPTVNLALAGQASATSSESANPASRAIDGDAGTDWCTSSWTGSLVIDLGQIHSLSDLGITLDATSPSASATIQVASQSGAWQPVPAARNVALDPGNPMYVPLPRNTQARYAQLTVWSDTGADVCVGEFRMFGRDPAAAGMKLGGDLSFTPQELAAGAKFTYRGQQQSPVTIMKENGANYVRMRLWVNPPPGYSNLASDLALARSVHEAGMKIYLDIMYSDFWADPQHQDIPASWAGQNLAQLTATVQSYTQQVISAFGKQGTPVDMVSIGNEIRNGILWPVGQVDPAAGTGYDALATLLKAGVAGARAGNPRSHQLLIMMHYDQGGNNQLSQAFYQNLVSRGVPFDVIGLSYYTFFHGTISQMKANVDALATQFHKPIVISETQYAWTLANGNSAIGDSTGNFVWEPSQISAGYPASPGGQLSFVTDELAILAQVPDGLGAGLFYWAPDWIPGVGWEPGAGVGTPNANLTLFNSQGVALPSIGIFQNPAAVCQSYDPYDVPCVVGG